MGNFVVDEDFYRNVYKRRCYRRNCAKKAAVAPRTSVKFGDSGWRKHLQPHHHGERSNAPIPPKIFCERAQQSAKLQLGDSKIEKNCCTPCCTFFSKGVKHHYRYTPICPGFSQRSQLNKVKVFRVFTRLSAAFPVLFRFSVYSSSLPK